MDFSTLQPGKFMIKCKADKYYIGRHVIEDKSFNPKRILALEHHMGETPKWELVKAEGGAFNHYTLRTRDTPTANLDGSVFALLYDDGNDKPTVWEIMPHPIFGLNYYTIAVANKPDHAWAAPAKSQDNGNGQIKIERITMKPLPLPQIIDTMLFEFEEA